MEGVVVPEPPDPDAVFRLGEQDDYDLLCMLRDMTLGSDDVPGDATVSQYSTPNEVCAFGVSRCVLCDEPTDDTATVSLEFSAACCDLWEERGASIMAAVSCKVSTTYLGHCRCREDLKDRMSLALSTENLKRCFEPLKTFHCFHPDNCTNAITAVEAPPVHTTCLQAFSAFFDVIGIGTSLKRH